MFNIDQNSQKIELYLNNFCLDDCLNDYHSCAHCGIQNGSTIIMAFWNRGGVKVFYSFSKQKSWVLQFYYGVLILGRKAIIFFASHDKKIF